MPDTRLLPPGHFLDLVDGRFAGTTAADLDTLFARLDADPGNHLVIHFHGGLVSRESAHASASILLDTYRDAGAYPVFFVWNSDLITAVRRNLDEIAKEKAFRRLVLRVGQLVLGKLGEAVLPVGARSTDTLDPPSLKDLPREDDLELLERELDAREAALGASPAQVEELSERQEEKVERELATDRVIIEEAQKIAAGLRDPAAVDAELGTRGASTVRGSTATLMSAEILRGIAAETPEPGARGIGTLVTLARFGAKVVRQVVRRYREGRDHGLYSTVVEEVLRGLYLDNVGVLVWNAMKNDTHDAFGGDPALHGGTAFLERLAEHWPEGRRVTLVGHSTGAIYIGRFLEAADRVLPPERRFDVVFLAAACSFPFLHQRLDLFRRRVDNVRSFGLSDRAERAYWEFPPVMKGSLLYFVSGVLEEDEVDMPLVGMERYFSPAGPYDRDDVREVAAYLVADTRVWAGAPDDLGPGRRCTGPRHGDFDDQDEAMRESLAHILRNGF